MRKNKLLTLVASLVLMLCLGMMADLFVSISYAQGQGKVVVRSANIRASADAGSAVVGSATQGATVTINGQTTDASGTVWYQVFVDANTLGYIRSDLVEISNGTVTDTPNTPAEPTAEVTAVHPMSATVSGSDTVRVRSDASTGSQIVAQARRDVAITVTGYANGADNRLWYQVNFIADGSEVMGFIRSDYVTLSGELVDQTQETQTPEVEQTQPEEPEDVPTPEPTKDWDTEYDGEKWILVNKVEQERWDINNIFETVKSNQSVFEEMKKDSETQMIIIVLLIILAIAMGGFIAALVFKIKDMRDSAYVDRIERETMRRRSADRPVQEKKVMHTVGADKKPGQGGQRPAGARPAGAPGSNGQRPTGARPAGAKPAGTRPAGARPVGANGQGERRPAAPTPTPKPQQGDKGQNPGWKSKNFMTEDDEFEFEFLNWDGDDE